MQLQERIRELALFNLAIDSKLRACDLMALTVGDVAQVDALVGVADYITKYSTYYLDGEYVLNADGFVTCS